MKKILFALMLTASTAALAEPLGMVIDVQGNATLGKNRLEMLSYLNPGNEVQLSNGASMTVTWYAGSKELKFAGPARLKVEAGGTGRLVRRERQSLRMGQAHHLEARLQAWLGALRARWRGACRHMLAVFSASHSAARRQAPRSPSSASVGAATHSTRSTWRPAVRRPPQNAGVPRSSPSRIRR